MIAAACAAAPYVVPLLPVVTTLAGRAVSNYIGAKGPAMIWDGAYDSCQNSAGVFRRIAAPVSFFVAGEAANTMSPAVSGAAKVAGLVIPTALNAAVCYFVKPAQEKHMISDEEYRQFVAYKQAQATE